MATKGQARVLRPLLLLLLLLAALFGYVIVADLKPRQGLDLKGGTSVILIPDASRGKPSKDALDQAVDIIRERVNGTGVSEAEVVAEGGNIRVALPDVGRDQALDIVGTTAELTFRKVEQVTAPGPATAQPVPTGTPSVTPSASGSARPSASASPSSVVRPPSASPTSGRALSAALLGNQATPSPSATPSRSPLASPSPSASPTGSPAPLPSPDDEGVLRLTDAQVQQLFLETDCTDETQRDVGRRFEATAPKIVSCDTDGTSKYLLGATEMKGDDVRAATATIDANQGGTGGWLVQLDFTREGTRKFADITRKYTGQQVAIVLDGVVKSAPNIEEPITGGTAQISGNFTAEEAQQLEKVLKYGSLPVVFDQSAGQTQTISPTLGQESLDAGILAGLIGFGLVIIYSLAYYRALGVVTVLGLMVFAGFNYVMVSILGEVMNFTLTLAGIAGLIVSVGITADSYVVFYERLKDEAREGKTLRQSVERGFQRAFRTLLAANFVSFLAAATLYLLSIGAVRGFAFTLGMATLLDVMIAYFFTRPMVTLLARTKAFREGRLVGIGSSLGPAHATKEA